MRPVILASPLKTFARDQRGAIALLFALCLPLLMLCVGVAVDMGRWNLAKRATSAAIDAAVLAGARTMQLQPNDPSAAIAMAGKVYAASIKDRIALKTDTVTFITANNGSALTATGAASMETTFLAVAGFTELDVVSAAGTKFPKAIIASGGLGGSNVEISLMLDVTGSMCDDGVGPCTGGTKINGLKAAAKNLIDIVVSANQATYTSKVAVVPFSTRVRVAQDAGGGSLMKQLTGLNPLWSGWINQCLTSSGSGGSETDGDWKCLKSQVQLQSNWLVMPCVTDRFYNNAAGFDATDVAPGSGRWLNAHGGDRMTVSWDSSDTLATNYLGKTNADPSNQWNYTSDGSCSDVGSSNVVMPLSSDTSSLKASIDGLQAYGSTAGALGTAWTWYTLSPNWSSIFTGSSQPRPYSDIAVKQANGAPLLRKVAVLMTDGGYNTYRGWKGQDQKTVSNYAIQLCTNMKAQGIEVYTVGFALDQLSPAEATIARATLQACGTDVSHFYETLTVPQLQAAFQNIALQMSALYLAQ